MAKEFFEGSDIPWASFHTFRREVGIVNLKTPSEEEPDDEDQAPELDETLAGMDYIPYTPQNEEEYFQQLEQWKGYMQEHGAFLIDKDEDIAALRALVFPDGGTKLNRAVVGKFPYQVGEMCGLNIPETAKIMLVKNQAWGEAEVLCREILFPIVRYTVYEKFEDAVDRAVANLEVEGAGHTSTLWTTNDDHVEYAAKRIPVGRFHINQPTMGGRIPIITSITIGCGTWGGNSVSENLTFRHLLNKTRVTREISGTQPWYCTDWDNFEKFNPLAE